jgi:hypothetical protein
VEVGMSEKLYVGNRPRSDGWGLVAEIKGEVRWLVFVRQGSSSDWLSLKIVADGCAPSKANYWLGWNGTRFSQKRDTEMLAEHRPELFKAVERFAEGYSLL